MTMTLGEPKLSQVKEPTDAYAFPKWLQLIANKDPAGLKGHTETTAIKLP